MPLFPTFVLSDNSWLSALSLDLDTVAAAAAAAAVDVDVAAFLCVTQTRYLVKSEKPVLQC